MTYEEMIIADTGCAPEDATMLEDIMRNEIFHSTLDWQARAQFRRGAKQAFTALEANRGDYEEYCRKARATFLAMQREQEVGT